MLVASAEKDKFEIMGTCGDNASASADETNYWTYSTKVFDTVINSKNIKHDGFFICGNHEWDPGHIGSTSQKAKNNIKPIGSKYIEDEDYVLFSFGVRNMNEGTKFFEDDITLLNTYLQSAPTDRPIFIMSHLPLHDGFGRTVGNGGKVIDTINENATGRTIIFLWGHNHTVMDTNYDIVYTPGKEIGSKTLNFNYCATGCMSDSEYGSGSAFVKGKGLIASIDTENGNKVLLKYYDANGNIVGTPTEAKKGLSN